MLKSVKNLNSHYIIGDRIRLASISIGMQTTFERNSIADAVNRILENLDNNAKSKVTPYIPQIEEHALQLIDNLRPKDTRRRKGDVVIAAAIYDTFLEFESRTGVLIRLPFIEDTLGQRRCSINSTWTNLFDDRVTLLPERLVSIRLRKDQGIDDAIVLVVERLAKAIHDKQQHVIDWLEEIKIGSIELIDRLPNTYTSVYDPLVIAVTIIYAAVKFYHGKMAIKISQRDLADLSGFSTSLVSKCWVELIDLLDYSGRSEVP